MERYIYSEKGIVNMAKREYSDKLKEMVLLDTLYVQSQDSRYYEKVVEIKWGVVVDMVEFWGYSPRYEEYYSLCDRVGSVLNDFVESQSSEILDNFLDNLR